MNPAETLTLTDPVYVPPQKRTLFARLFAPLIRDERDLPFIRTALFLTALFIPAAIYLFFPGNFRWWMAPIYWAGCLTMLGPYILMLHNTSHRVLFEHRYRWLNRYIPWVIGPFIGQSPETYYAHHIGIHHVDGNLPEDLSSTMPYQRDSFIDFLKYFWSFLVGYPAVYHYFRRHRRRKLMRKFLVGEGSFFLLTAIGLYLNWQAAVVVFVVPLLLTRFMLMAGNWGQHAFVDPEEPNNDWKSVITFINSPYNHRCFNDGYHLGHHLKPSRHWLEMPTDFLDKVPEMIRQDSLVFRKLDYFMIFVLLMLKRYRFLARFYVNLNPSQPRSEDEIVSLLKRRLRKFDEAQVAAWAAVSPSSPRKPVGIANASA